MTDYRIVWVHGVGEFNPGYSAEWTNVFNPYLDNLPGSDFIEVYWRKVFLDKVNELKQNAAALASTSQQQTEVQRALLTTLLTLAGANQALLQGWLMNQDAFVGEFVKYLVDKGIRDAVKEAMKATLRPLAGKGYDISIIAHSWGTVVAYESLLDLQQELPAFQVIDLFTLGSPLWLILSLLDNKSGDKPRNVKKWVNIHAQGDLIALWPIQDFQIDIDKEVPDFSGGNDPHDSYFLSGNVAVQRAIVAANILA